MTAALIAKLESASEGSREIKRLLDLAFKAGAKPRAQISDADLLSDFVDVVWHGDKEVWESNRWVLKLNQIWLNDARAALLRASAAEGAGQ